MRILLSLLSCLLLSLPLIAAEQPVSAPANDAIATYGPLLAETNGRDFLVAWTHFGRLSRITAGGELLDPVGIAAGAQDIASNGQDYVVVGRCAGGGFTICVSLLNAGNGSLTSIASFEGFSAAVAWNGSRFLVVIAQESSGSLLRGVFLNRDGTPDSQPFAIPIPLAIESPRLASDGRNFLVIGNPHGTGHLRAARIADDGTSSAIEGYIHLADPTDNNLLNTARDYQVASDGYGFLVRWSMQTDYGVRPTTFVRALTPAGEPAAPAIRIGTGPSSVSAATAGYLLILGSGPSVEAIRLSSTGERVSQAVTIADGWEQDSVAIVRSGELWLVAWTDNVRANPWEKVAFAQLLDASGTPLGHRLVLSSAVRSQQMAAGIWGQASGLVAWVEHRGASRAQRVVVGRINRDGEALDGAGKVLWDSGADQSGPSLSFDGRDYLITWLERSSLYRDDRLLALRVAEDGSLLDPAPITLDEEAAARPVISWNGVTHVLVWPRWDRTLAAMALYPSGATATPVRTVAVPPAESNITAASPSVAWNGEHHLVLFVHAYPCPSGIMCPPPRRALQTLVLDPFVNVVSTQGVSGSSSITGSPSLVWAGTRFIAAWDTWSGSQTSLFVAPLSGTGDRFLSPPRRVVDLEITNVSLAWNGSEVVAAASVPYASRTRNALLGIKIDALTLATKAHFVGPDGRAAGVLIPAHGAMRLLYSREVDSGEATTPRRVFTIEYLPQVRQRPVGLSGTAIEGRSELAMY